jgi:hypothetical protein
MWSKRAVRENLLSESDISLCGLNGFVPVISAFLERVC